MCTILPLFYDLLHGTIGDSGTSLELLAIARRPVADDHLFREGGSVFRHEKSI